MGKTIDKIFKELDAKNVKQVMVSFSDLDGRVYHPVLLYDGSKEDKRRIAEELLSPGMKDGIMNGLLPTDGSSFPGFDLDTAYSDMVIAADLSTFKVWEQKERDPTSHLRTENIAHFWADIKNPDGTEYDCCPRTILKRAIAKAEDRGIIFTAGSENEFFVSTEPKRLVHIDEQMYYQKVPRWLVDAARDLRARGLETDYIHHEVAPSQFEVRVTYKKALEKADDVLIYKDAFREAAELQGLSITFMPKPQDGINGSGMHVHWGMFDSKGNNLMHDEAAENGLSREGEVVLAGLMKHAPESALIHNPTINSYRRLKPGYEAPTYICWGAKNRTAMFRQPAERTRIENRVLDGVGSPHLKFAVLMSASLAGAETLEAPVEENVFHSNVRKERGLIPVPQDFGKAIYAAKDSEFLAEALGDRAYKKFISAREKEWGEYQSEVGRLKGKSAEAKRLEWECRKYWDR